MNFIQSAMWGTAKTLGKGAVGGMGSRALVGGLAGGIYQAATTDQEETTNYLESIGRGIIGGATLGAASRLVTPGWIGGELRRPLVARGALLKKLPDLAYKAGKFGLKSGLNIANFAMNHPYATLGIIGGGIGLANLSGQPMYSEDIYSSSSQMNLGISNMSNQLYQMKKQRTLDFMQSTTGLTFGAHASRHGG